MTEAFQSYERTFNQDTRTLIGMFHTAPTANEQENEQVHECYVSAK